MKAAVADDKVPMREIHGHIIVTAMPPHYDRIRAVLDELSTERLVEPE